MPYHILIVDDDDQIRLLLGEFLIKKGFVVSIASSTAECEKILGYFKVDLTILDLMMPKETGIDFLKRYDIGVPTIMLSALSDVEDRIEGLKSGADDYLGKPFEPKELLLRIERILSRTHRKKVKLGENSFDLSNNLLTDTKGRAINLTSLERKLLRYLIENVGEIVSRETLMKQVDQHNQRYMDLCIARLRSKVEKIPRSPKTLLTVRNKGYVIYLG